VSTSPDGPDVQGVDTDAQILNNEFLAGSIVGIQVAHGHPRIEGNTFRPGCGTTYGAISGRNTNSLPVVRSNVFLNDLAILITAGNMDLAVVLDQGFNDFQGVTGVSIQHDGPADVSAIGNYWPNDPPIFGVDIIINGAGSVTATTVPVRQVSVGELKARS